MTHVSTWRSEGKLQKSVLSSHHVGPGDHTTQVIRVGEQHFSEPPHEASS